MAIILLRAEVTVMDLSKLFRKTRISYHHRQFMLMAVFMWIIVACFTVFQYNRERTFKAELIDQDLQGANYQVVNRLEKGERIEDICKDLQNIRISLISKEGNVIFDSHVDSVTSNHLTRPEIQQALRHGKGHSTERFSSTTNTTYFYSATYCDNFIVRSALPYTVSLREILSADMVFLWFMLFITGIVTLVAYFITRRLSRNITRLNDFASKAERGEKIDINETFSHDELGEISQNIIQLYALLQKTTADRDREHQTVLHEQQEKIRIKKLLTNNINHELKTPVTAILGYMEAMVNTPQLPEDKRRSFIESCYKQACRLQDLLQDVSTITRMDESTELVKKEKVSIDEIIEEVKTEMQSRGEDKRLRVNCALPEGLSLQGDYSLVSAIFRNLAYNASSYSGGRDIFINLIKETETHYVMSFADNGIGVGEEHLDKLFERFYRVDKGRSRKDGGTGLGLSIVKNAVVLHGGEISVSNRVKGGLEFTFSLCKNS
ncbi:MAG: ATP-binding protein [Rikenellaceae bacterium]